MDLDLLPNMESQDNPHTTTSERNESDSILFLSPAARAVLSDEYSTVGDLKVLYRELLRRVQTVCDVNRLEAFCEAYVRCCDDFKSLLQGCLQDLDSALTWLEHLIADLERRRVTLMKRVLSSRRRCGHQSRRCTPASDRDERAV